MSWGFPRNPRSVPSPAHSDPFLTLNWLKPASSYDQLLKEEDLSEAAHRNSPARSDASQTFFPNLHSGVTAVHPCRSARFIPLRSTSSTSLKKKDDVHPIEAARENPLLVRSSAEDRLRDHVIHWPDAHAHREGGT
ncbi:unnamed protein product, partial [Pleuronectes platessa]